MEGLVFDQSVPVYDPLKLMVLAHEAGETAAQRFLDDYLGLLPTRKDRIVAELSEGEVEEAMDAVVSLKVTSSMVGAIRLKGYCQQLQDQLTVGNIADVAAVAADLGGLVPAFIRAVKGA
jgi:histidine phosphotransfer protein HptB